VTPETPVPASPAATAESAQPRGLPRLLFAVALTTIAFGAIWGASVAAGYGRDLHPLRVAATVLLMLSVAIALAWSVQTPLARIGGVVAVFLIGAVAWWQVPCRTDGPNLLNAAARRNALRRDMEVVAFEEVKRGRHFQQSLESLAADYPTLAASLRPEFARWGADAENALLERLHETPSSDIAKARALIAPARDLGKVFPDRRETIDTQFRAWFERATLSRIDTLNSIRLANWDEFNRTLPARQPLAQALAQASLPEMRAQLVAAEQSWVVKSAGAATESALAALDARPGVVRRVCGEVEQRIRGLKSIDRAASEFHAVRVTLFRTAHDAAGREVLQHIRAEHYLPAFTTAVKHEQAWLKVADLLSAQDKKQMAELREQARHLAIRFEKAGFVDAAPEPRGREIAPMPRSRP